MITKSEGETYVTWKAFLTTTATAGSLVISLGWIGWQVHASQPHHDAVTEREFDRHTDGIEKRLTRIENKIDQVLGKP